MSTSAIALAVSTLKICADCVLGGYSDWFLPSKDELNAMYNNLHLNGLGSFTTNYYWSSSEASWVSTWWQSFSTGAQQPQNKSFPGRVRAARAFSTTPSLTCGNQIIDTRDGKSYNTVQIGTQCWMAENLAYLPQVDSAADGSEDTPGKYYYVYDYTPTGASEAEEIANAKLTTNYINYGVLYNWTAAMDDALSSPSNPSGVQGACPNGWHLPSDAEWTQLTTYLGGVSVAGGKMKETGTTHWASPNTGAENTSGFTALPGGYRSSAGTFSDVGGNANFWSSTEGDTYGAWYRYPSYSSATVSRSTYIKVYGFSVRCVKD